MTRRQRAEEVAEAAWDDLADDRDRDQPRIVAAILAFVDEENKACEDLAREFFNEAERNGRISGKKIADAIAARREQKT